MPESADAIGFLVLATPLRVDRSENVLAALSRGATQERSILEVAATYFSEVLATNPRETSEMRSDSNQKNLNTTFVPTYAAQKRPSEGHALETSVFVQKLLETLD